MKKTAYILLLIGIHFLSNGFALQAQQSNATLIPENINLITDRDVYLSGEPIWFSATIRLNGEISELSKVLFIELFNADQKSIVRKKYKLDKGLAKGIIDIPSEFLSDTYYLRAYTHYSKNFPASSFFFSAIQIINPKVGITSSLVNEKSVFSKSLEQDTSGKETNTANYTFESELSNNGQHIITIIKNNPSIDSKNKLFNLKLINSNLQTLSSSDFTINDKSTQVILPNSGLNDSGLYYFVLTNESGHIIKMEAFLHSSQFANNEIQPIQKNYSRRQVVNFEIDENKNKDILNIGYKVVLKGTVLTAYQKINQYFEEPILLFNYLKTQFQAEDLNQENRKEFLSALNKQLEMQNFKDLYTIPKVELLKWVPEIRDIGLSGIVVNKNTQLPIDNVPIYLSLFRDNPQIHIYNSRKDGSFFFSINNFEGIQDVFICPLFENMDELELKVNTDFSPEFPKLKAIPLSMDSSNIDLIEQMLVASQTTQVFKVSPKTEIFQINQLPYSFENPDISVVLDDYIETPTLEMVFKELIPKVRVRKRKDDYSISVFDDERETYYKNPLILIDEVPVFDVNELMKVSPKSIERIGLHRTPIVLGDQTINGIIMIHTFTDNFGGMIMPKSSTFFEYQTLSPSYTFQAKKYTSPEEINSRTADFRTLLQWKPILSRQASSFNFYTSDLVGEYEVYIWGNDQNNRSMHSKLFDFKVEIE